MYSYVINTEALQLFKLTARVGLRFSSSCMVLHVKIHLITPSITELSQTFRSQVTETTVFGTKKTDCYVNTLDKLN